MLIISLGHNRLSCFVALDYEIMSLYEREQEGSVLNPFLNPLEFWQRYNWIQVNKRFYENAIRSNGLLGVNTATNPLFFLRLSIPGLG